MLLPMSVGVSDYMSEGSGRNNIVFEIVVLHFSCIPFLFDFELTSITEIELFVISLGVVYGVSTLYTRYSNQIINSLAGYL